MNTKYSEREFDFAPVIAGVPEITDAVSDKLFKSGCSDATFSIQYGQLYAEFLRSSPSFKDAVLTAILDVRNADVGAVVRRVDECDLVTPSDMARRIGRSRQMVHQYLNGVRGPGNFPPPICRLNEGSPLWAWCDVSHWLAQNNIIRAEKELDAAVVAIVNNSLEAAIQHEQHPQLTKEVSKAVNPVGSREVVRYSGTGKLEMLPASTKPMRRPSRTQQIGR